MVRACLTSLRAGADIPAEFPVLILEMRGEVGAPSAKSECKMAHMEFCYETDFGPEICTIWGSGDRARELAGGGAELCRAHRQTV